VRPRASSHLSVVGPAVPWAPLDCRGTAWERPRHPCHVDCSVARSDGFPEPVPCSGHGPPILVPCAYVHGVVRLFNAAFRRYEEEARAQPVETTTATANSPAWGLLRSSLRLRAHCAVQQPLRPMQKTRPCVHDGPNRSTRRCEKSHPRCQSGRRLALGSTSPIERSN
jgi:hypothetical protein